MVIVFIIIGIVGLWLLWTIALNQKVIAKNQVGISKILKQILEKM